MSWTLTSRSDVDLQEQGAGNSASSVSAGPVSGEALLTRGCRRLNAWLILVIYSPGRLIPGDVTSRGVLLKVVSIASHSCNFLPLRGGDRVFKTGLKALTVRES